MAKNIWNPDAEDGEELDPRLAARLAALPRELEPSRDLWPGVAARLDLQRSGLAPAAAPLPFLRRPAFWRQAAAALLAAAVGAAITYLALGGARPDGPGFPAGSPAASSGVVPAAFAPGDALADPADYRLIEADYLRAKEALWVSVYSRRSQFSADTLQAVEKNFAIIDQAIFDLRRALAQDPGNRRLEEELYRNHRRGLDLLRRLADTT